MISALVPTRGGDARLERNLPSLFRALEASDDAWEVLVLDDGQELRRAPDGVRLLSFSQPRGYGPAVNGGAAAAAGTHLLILNDDVRLEQGAVAALRGALPSEGVFATVPRILSPLARCGDESGKRAFFRAGMIELEEQADPDSRPTLYPVGCCYLCPKEAFLALGGYDEVYAPFFWEDVDLGYRAWRRGLASLRVPTAVCHHEGSATIGRRSIEERQRAWHGNWALFHMRNVQDPRWRASSLGALAAYALFDERLPVLEGMAEAVDRFLRAGPRRDRGLTDAQILARAQKM
jgi:GT2 family glycosyltransferase